MCVAGGRGSNSVRSKREHANTLEQALADLASALKATRIPWMVIGGIATIARGVRRMTTDIDAAVRGDRVDVGTLLRALATKQIKARIDNAEQFARESLVLLLRHEPTGVDFDLSLAWTDFEWDAIEHASMAAFGAIRAPMARPEDLIVFKVIAGRPRDLEDVVALLVLYPKIDHARIREYVQQLATLADQPELAAGLEMAITTSAKQRVRAPKPRAKPNTRTKRRTTRTGPKPKRTR